MWIFFGYQDGCQSYNHLIPVLPTSRKLGIECQLLVLPGHTVTPVPCKSAGSRGNPGCSRASPVAQPQP